MALRRSVHRASVLLQRGGLHTACATLQKDGGRDDAPQERPKIPKRHGYSPEDCTTRRQWVEEFASTKLPESSVFWSDRSLDTSILRGNIEMPIGMTKIPLAVAGPLLFDGTHAKGYHLLPMATTEGALVASVNRGATLLSECGGVATYAGQQQMSRAPMFLCDNPDQAHRLGRWIQSQRRAIQEQVVSKHSKVANLINIQPVYDQECVHTWFMYETGDASGQNATTVCTWNAIKWIVEQMKVSDINIRHSWIDGQVSGDKKPSSFNGVIGRGMSVSARCVIPERTLNDVLNITSDLFLEWNKWQSRMVSRVGAPSNLNISNVLAACFAATGQDIACVGESCTGIFSLEPNTDSNGIVATLHIPSLIIGTVGGGTKLPSQAEGLSIMGCVGDGKARKLGEIIAGYCLALDLSTGSAVGGGEFSDSHNKLGRNRPTEQ